MTVNLLDFERTGFAQFCAEMGEKPFRARQLMRWIHQSGVDDFAAMTDISKASREEMKKLAEIRAPAVVGDTTAADGTRKWLLEVGTGNAIETVFIPERNRGTLCISSQAGCALACTFCATGTMGLGRNLTDGEIVEQALRLARLLRDEQGAGVSNIVMMGMGEPFHNYDNVLAALRELNDPQAFGLGARQIAISTVGWIPGMDRLADEQLQFKLALSLHAPNDQVRSQLMPVTKRFPVSELMRACGRYRRLGPSRFTVAP